MAYRFNIDQILAKRRLSIVELSDRTGLSVTQIQMLKDQVAIAIKLKTLDALCKALNCTPNDLLRDESEET